MVKKKSKKDFRLSRSSFYFPYFNRTQALCVAVCFWSEDWVGFNWVGTLLFKLGVFFVVFNYICLSFMQIHAHFYINYIIYYGLLIFCCQNVATHLL